MNPERQGGLGVPRLHETRVIGFAYQNPEDQEGNGIWAGIWNSGKTGWNVILFAFFAASRESLHL
jgi:hypothetical protein